MVQKSKIPNWVWNILLLVVLMAGAYFRLVGQDWDEGFHLHPDERFLTMVETAISPVDNLSDYFNTAESSLNPHNNGHTFYVYGTLPLFLVRYVAEWVGQTGYDQVHLVGRALSAIADLLIVLMVYLIADRLYRNKGLAVLAASFSAFAVMQIQLSHYFTVDTFANFFTFLAFYFAVRVLTEDPEKQFPGLTKVEDIQPTGWQKLFIIIRYPAGNILEFILFGTALGMAMASKVSIAPLALVIPAAALLKLLQSTEVEREFKGMVFFRNLILAAVISLVVFRICQPYAFEGPGFFGFTPNEKWFKNLSDLSQQSKGNVDFPPALQWARRPLSFALENLVLFGLGLPLGILAWAGYLFMGIRVFRGEWHRHALIWVWTGVYYIWQSVNFTRSMRYQIPIYPTLAIIAAWFLFSMFKRKNEDTTQPYPLNTSWYRKTVPVVIGFFVLLTTFMWAFAFTRIYTRPVTRVSASEWIYLNVPTAINLFIETGEDVFPQRIAFNSGLEVSPDKPAIIAFTPETSSILEAIDFSNIVSKPITGEIKELQLAIYEQNQAEIVLSQATQLDTFQGSGDLRGNSYTVPVEPSLQLSPGKTYYLKITQSSPSGGMSISGSISLDLLQGEEKHTQALPDPVETIDGSTKYSVHFTALKSGTLSKIQIPHIVDWEANPEQKTLKVSVMQLGEEDSDGSSALIADDFLAIADVRGDSYDIQLDPPLQLVEKTQYVILFELVDGSGSLALYGIRQAIESSWDDALPLSMFGYSPFDYSRGIYRSEFNLEMYWDDDENKRDRFVKTLDNSDYIFISSNRQWGTTVRVPERYPMTETYYRNLLGCPPEKEVLWCYRVAEPGMFKERLGFELVQIFQSDPNIGGLRINTQFAEEAFTVYDHPKVMIFKKLPTYDKEKVRQVFYSVDLSKVIHLTPREASSYKGNLDLPTDRLSGQRSGGTWSDLFSRTAIINKSPWISAILWYLFFLFLGWVNIPVTRLAFHGLYDKGYPVVRLVGMVLMAYLVWMAGSAGIMVTKPLIFLVLALITLVNGIILIKQGKSAVSEIKGKWKYYLAVEGIFLAFFLFFLLVRLGNPDLWHPYKGGEKPMDFSYLNAVIKSSTYPPYDPWYAGGYINYYYYGFVLVGVPIKLLGIIPSTAYNLVLPTLFALLAAAAFSVGWNLLTSRSRDDENISADPALIQEKPNEYLGGIVSAAAILIIGNLGTVRMIWQGFQKLTAPGGDIGMANVFQRTAWGFQGILKFINGANMPYAYGEWYWNPSRVIPGEPITEFPYFTFLYADLHAHMIALPLTVLALLWTVSMIKGGWSWGIPVGKDTTIHLVVNFLLGGLVIGALKPTNSWDYPVFLGIGILAVIYTYLRNNPSTGGVNAFAANRPDRLFKALFWAGLLGALFLVLYQPFSNWYGQAYTAIDLWEGERTPIASYTTHWGLFLFVFTSWLVFEYIDWMAKTPLSSLRRLKPYMGIILVSLVVGLVVAIGLLFLGVQIAWIVLPLVLGSAFLIFRPDQADEKRIVLGMGILALLLTLAVELIVLVGDIGRMNTVFKFYLQAWTLFSLASAVSLIWILRGLLTYSSSGWQNTWKVFFTLLAAGAFLFPVFASIDKIRDRMDQNAPHNLDGMTYMVGATYFEKDVELILDQDYKAIQWMQDNIQGSPVIVEANTPEYRWGNRFTIYTGLPGVVGWNWHQRQQRAVVPSEWVTKRVEDISGFYNSLDRELVIDFLERYDVSYVIVGQLERAYYGENGLKKFSEWNGDLWEMVYHSEETFIYQVIHE